MPLLSLLIAHNWTHPFPAPDAARSLFLHTVTELTQDCAVEIELFALISLPSAQSKRGIIFNKITENSGHGVKQQKEKVMIIKKTVIYIHELSFTLELTILHDRI